MRIWIQLMLLVYCDVFPSPPSFQSGQAVTSDSCHRKTPIFLRCFETAFAGILLKKEHTIGKNAARVHFVTESRRYGPEILANYEAAVPMALKGQYSC